MCTRLAANEWSSHSSHSCRSQEDMKGCNQHMKGSMFSVTVTTNTSLALSLPEAAAAANYEEDNAPWSPHAPRWCPRSASLAMGTVLMLLQPARHFPFQEDRALHLHSSPSNTRLHSLISNKKEHFPPTSTFCVSLSSHTGGEC